MNLSKLYRFVHSRHNPKTRRVIMFEIDTSTDRDYVTEASQSNTQMNLNYQAYWMPFSANRNFHQDPRMIVGAQGSYLIDSHGREIYDSLSG